MPKISNLAENEVPDPNLAQIAFQSGPGSTSISIVDEFWKGSMGVITNWPSKRTMVPQESDMISSNAANTRFYPFTIGLLGAGIISNTANTDADHIGIGYIDSGAAANTGGYITVGGVSSVLIGGGEVFEAVVKIELVANTVQYFGFFDTITTTAPVDAVALRLSAGVIAGIGRNNNTETITGTTYTPVAGTWYHLKIEVNSAANLVTFTISDMAGTVLWTNTVAANIPTAAGRETGCGVFAYKTNVTAAALCKVDLMSYYNEKVLAR